MSESFVVYDASRNAYIDVTWLTYAPWEGKLNIADCRKYYPWYVNWVLRDGLWGTHKTPEWFKTPDKCTHIAFFNDRILVAIWYIK